MTARSPLILAAATALVIVALAAPASAKSFEVCSKGCTYTSIQDAVDASGKGDTVAVKPGTYKEGVIVVGHKHDKLTLKGNPSNPNKVKLMGKGLKGDQAQNAVAINGADGITLNGFYGQDFKANGFYVSDADGYKFTNLIAKRDGEYGLFAFNSLGGSMTNSTASEFNDSGFYVGQTPVQSKPKRTTISKVTSFLNVLGYSGTNSRYVDIKNSSWYNNGAGIVPNSLDTEKFPPNAENTITGNKVFWNNFNYYLGAPFKEAKTEVEAGSIPFPVGVGILLFGGRGNKVSNNQIYGNWLTGFAMLDAFQLKAESQRPLIDNQITNNVFGLGGTDLNGRDISYDGGGTGNCFEGNQGVSTVFPADGSTIVPCTTPPTANVFNDAARAEAISWAVDPNHEAGWIPHEHAPQAGLTAIEHFGG
jgi:hypothetical protein